MLDDSQTALLQNGANRKKQSTSYKRPGPPTPSKHAGRLSIGGMSDINYTNVLKDSTNMENAQKKTPSSRLKNIFSSSKFRDEVSVAKFFYRMIVHGVWRKLQIINALGFTGN